MIKDKINCIKNLFLLKILYGSDEKNIKHFRIIITDYLL